jgi:hypothetical protein
MTLPLQIVQAGATAAAEQLCPLAARDLSQRDGPDQPARAQWPSGIGRIVN